MLYRTSIAVTIVGLYANTGWTQPLGRELAKVEAALAQLEREFAAAQKEISEAEDGRHGAQIAWLQCSKRRGVKRMDRYVDEIEGSRRAAEDNRKAIEARRLGIETRRLLLEASRSDDASAMSLAKNYLIPMATIL